MFHRICYNSQVSAELVSDVSQLEEMCYETIVRLCEAAVSGLRSKEFVAGVSSTAGFCDEVVSG